MNAGKMDEARALQARLIPVNTAVTSGYGVAGLKAALEFVAHYGGAPRRPLAPLGEGERVQACVGCSPRRICSMRSARRRRTQGSALLLCCWAGRPIPQAQ